VSEQGKLVVTFKKELILKMADKAIRNILKESQEFREKTILDFMREKRYETKWLFFRKPAGKWDRMRAEQEYDHYVCKTSVSGFLISPDWLDEKIAYNTFLEQKWTLWNAISHSSSEEVNLTIDEFKILRNWSGMCMEKLPAEVKQEEVKP